MGVAKPPAPPSVMMPPPAAHPAILGSSTVDSALKAQKDLARASVFTDSNTIATGPQGLKTPTTAKHTLLG